MADKIPAVPTPDESKHTAHIVHAKHGDSHCHVDQLEAMLSEGWKLKKDSQHAPKAAEKPKA